MRELSQTWYSPRRGFRKFKYHTGYGSTVYSTLDTLCGFEMDLRQGYWTILSSDDPPEDETCKMCLKIHTERMESNAR